MGSPLILEDVKQVRQLAEVIWRQEANAITSINFPSEQERSKYLRDCGDNNTTIQQLLNQGVELKEKYQNDAVRCPIANDIFLYIIYCCNTALQTVPKYTVRKDYLSKITAHVKSLIEKLVKLDTGNPDDVSTLKEEAAKYKECMLELVENYRSPASAEYSGRVNKQGLTFDQLVQKYQDIRGLGGLFEDLKEEEKLLVYDDIVKASGRGSVVKSWISKAMAGFATGILGASILGAIAGSLIELIITTGGATNITTDGHKCYVAPMPDGVVLARQIAHNQTN